MAPRHHHRHRGGGRGFAYPYPVDYGPVIVQSSPDCIAIDKLGRPHMVPCDAVVLSGLGSLGDGEAVTVVDVDESTMRGTITRSAMNIANGTRRRGGSTPYFRFGAQTPSYPFDWHGWPGGVPQGTRAAETRSLSGADLYESGLSPYSVQYPPLAHRGFRAPLEGFLSDLSTNEQKLLGLIAAAGAGLFLWKRFGKRPRKNPSPRIRRGRKRRRVRRRR